jgi:hydrogenase nickel incorporation protein HypA/HybF
MHELTIAQNIIAIVIEEAAKYGNQPIRTIFFKAGLMNAIIPESLSFGFETLKKEHALLQQAQLEISTIPLVIKCPDCGKETQLEEPLFFCPSCSSTRIEIITGKDMFIESIEFDD